MAKELSPQEKASNLFVELEKYVKNLEIEQLDNLTMINHLSTMATQFGLGMGLNHTKDLQVAILFYRIADRIKLPGLKAIYLFNGVLGAIYPNGALGKRKIQKEELQDVLRQMYSIVPDPMANLPIFLNWAWDNYRGDHQIDDLSEFIDFLNVTELSKKINSKGGAKAVPYTAPAMNEHFYKKPPNKPLPDLPSNLQGSGRRGAIDNGKNIQLKSVRSSRNRYSSSRRGRAAVVDVDDIADSIQDNIDQIVDYAREQDEMIAENETRLDNLESQLLHRRGRRYGGSGGGGRNRWF